MPDQKKKKHCFVISPIGAVGSPVRIHADKVFEYIINPAIKTFNQEKNLELEAVRSDHIYKSGRISKQMFRSIMDSDLCIVVLTFHNPNVFYELAVAQSAARPVILLQKEGSTLPFDIQDLRTIPYQFHPGTKGAEAKYTNAVVKMMHEIDDNGWTALSLVEQYDISPAKLSSEQQFRKMVLNSHPEPLDDNDDGEDHVYRFEGWEGQLIIRKGDIGQTLKYHLGPDVVVSLEDTYLQLARYYDASISGILRYFDALDSGQGRIEKDLLYEEIRQNFPQNKLPVDPGSVITTTIEEPHGLAQYGVKYIFHVAAMQAKGGPGEGYCMMDEKLDNCVENVFDQFDKLAKADDELTSILFPMLGAGSTKLSIDQVAKILLQTIVTRMKRKRPKPRCETIYLLVWLESHRYAVTQVAEEMGLQDINLKTSVGHSPGN